MKMKLLFPLLFIGLIVLSFVFTWFFGVVIILSLPAMMVVDVISESVGGPVDTTYYVILVDLLLFAFLGHLWDIIVPKLKQLPK